MVQEGCFRYYWEAANRRLGHGGGNSARRREPGGRRAQRASASWRMLVAIEREFITRDEGVERMLQDRAVPRSGPTASTASGPIFSMAARAA